MILRRIRNSPAKRKPPIARGLLDFIAMFDGITISENKL